MTRITPLLLAAATFVSSSLAANTADWQRRSIYQVVTDRFAKTVDDGGPCDSAARQYCGGTWQGIVNHLDYIQGMGFDAVWISPVVENIEGNTTYGAAYHGYWPLNFDALNSHFGTQADLMALSDALHKRGMYLMIDVVINHVAATSVPATGLTFNGYTPYNQATDYHPFCWVTDYNNQTQVEQCWVGDEKVALVDLDTENQSVIDRHNAWIKNLVTTYKVDGIRIDTVKHIRQSFYPDFVKSAGVFSIGEVLDIRANYTGAYTDYMDSTFNYPQWFKLVVAFQNIYADMGVLVQSFKDTQQYFKNGGIGSTVSFSENHDNARLPALIPDPVLVKSIITWTFVGDGIPTLYYGQEAAYSGGNDPMNREALWFTSYSKDVALYPYIKKLNYARKLALTTIKPDFASTPASIVSSTLNNVAVAKYPMLSVFTNLGNASTATWTVPNTGHAKDVVLIDIASDKCDSVTVASDGSIGVTFNLGAPKVYLPATALNSTDPSSLCASKAVKGSGTAQGSAASAAGQTFVAGGVTAVLAAALACLTLL